MKTVAEIAKLADVSVQTVYRALKKIKQSETGDITKKKANITYVTSDGEALLLERLTEGKANVQQTLNDDKEVLNEVKQEENEEIIYLREQNTALQAELKAEREHSRLQYDKLAAITEQMLEMSKNQQVLLGREQDRNNLLLTESSKRKGIWQMFKKPKSE